MARITIEDCIEKVPNRFKLVQMAAIRAKQLKRGASAFVEKENKEVVTALREIAAGIVRPDEMAEPTVGGEATASPSEATASPAAEAPAVEEIQAAEESAPAEKPSS